MAFTAPLNVTKARQANAASGRCGARRPLMMMATTEAAGTGAKLSARARDLKGYLRAHKSIFRAGDGFASTQAILCRKNDTGRMLIPLDELQTNEPNLPGAGVARFMLEHHESLLEKACEAAFAVQGELKTDQVLKEIVQHDMALVYRVVSYAIAVSSSSFLHENNVAILAEFHREVGFTRDARNKGLESLSEAIVGAASDAEVAQNVSECFKMLASALD